MRTTVFVLAVKVSRQYWKAERKDADAFAQQMLNIASDEDLRGPRGGRYRPIGLPYDVQSSERVDNDFAMNLVTYSAHQRAVYVRPRR
jgi:hypothetical protein